MMLPPLWRDPYTWVVAGGFVVGAVGYHVLHLAGVW